MSRVEVFSTVGPDGVLRLNVPLPADANRNVRVTVEPIRPAMTQEEWAAMVYELAGTWEGEFERPDQGVLEEREPLS
jgi:hypothetical protein